MNNRFSKVEYTKKLGLGGATFGNLLADGIFGGVDKENSIEIITQAFNLGIRIFDTAPFYGLGKSELWYGEALKNLNRRDYNLTTKCGRLLKNPEDLTRPVSKKEIEEGKVEAVFDYSESGIRRSVDESLKRLGVDYLDTLLLHDPDWANKENEALRNAFPAMLKMKEEKIIQSIGCGMNEWEMPSRFIEQVPIDKVLLAGRYTLLENSSSSGFMNQCREKNVKVIIGGPYNSGILARNLNAPVSYNYEIAPVAMIEKARSIEKITSEFKVSLKATSMQFVLSHPQVFSVVPGMSSIEEVKDNIAVSKQAIPKDLWEELYRQGYIQDKKT